MAIERANILYPRNSTTVDTGTGIDVRLLDDVNGATNDATQTATATHTQDNIERTFDPATGGVTNTNDANTTMFKLGWALRLAEDMTPVDDTNCNAILPANTLSVALDVTINQSGGTYASGTYGPTWKASLWRYNPSTDSGTLIAAGTVSTPTWTVGGIGVDLGTFKVATISIVVASSVEFAAGEILFLQLGLNTGTIPNPTLGTATWTYTVRVDDTNTKITFGSSLGVRQVCVLATSLIGLGTVSRGGLLITISKSLTGTGTITFTKLTIVSKTFDLIGKGTITKLLAIVEDFDLVGKGIITASKSVIANKSFNLIGKGEVARVLSVGINKSLSGVGTISLLKQVIASKSFALVGKGLITEVHPVQAYRTFNLVGKGEILQTGPNGSTITIPIDEVPTGSGSTIINTTIFAVMD